MPRNPNDRYFIVRQEDLAMYGDRDGVATVAEANAMLRDTGEDDLVVISGHFMPLEKKINTRLLGT